MIFAEIFSPEILIPIALIALLFGSAKIPQMARSLGTAKHEFEKGVLGKADEEINKTTDA